MKINAGKGAMGGLSGAATGAALGSVVPGIGTAVGAIGGGLIGLLGSGIGEDDAPAAAHPDIYNPVGQGQIAAAENQTQSGLQQQQAFVNALQAQNGIQNQSSVFNQYQNLANGQGPNPAQAALNQATGQNVANQAALMASQRGAGANAGLIARQAAQQGGAIQQQAAGQGATMQAQQQLAAMGQLSGIAGQQVGQQANALGTYNQLAQNQQQNLLNAQGQFNNAQVSGQNSVNAANAPMNLSSQQAGQNMAGGLLGGAGTALTALKGGATTATPGPSTQTTTLAGGAGDNMGALQSMPLKVAAEGGLVPGPSSFAARHLRGFAQGGAVEALVSPGERYLPPKDVKKVAEGEKAPMEAGEKIPGKAKVSGAKNDYANDTVPKRLQEGGIVLPRSVTQAKDPAAEAHKFVTAILAKKGQGLKK